ncbi:hypothetical protein M8494_20250 [Serratia ureilytica]
MADYQAALDDAGAVVGRLPAGFVMLGRDARRFPRRSLAPLLQPSSSGAHRRTRRPASVGGYSFDRPAIRRRTHGQPSPFLGGLMPPTGHTQAQIRLNDRADSRFPHAAAGHYFLTIQCRI